MERNVATDKLGDETTNLGNDGADVKAILRSLQGNPELVVIVLNLAGTGVTRDELLAALFSLMARAAPIEQPPHLLRPAAYAQFLAARQLKDNASSAAIYDRMAVVTQETCYKYGCPRSNVFDVTRLRCGIYGVHDAADLATISKEDIRKLCESQSRSKPTKGGTARFVELERWFKSSFGMEFLD